MKQIYTLLVAMCALLFTGCSKDDDNEPLNVEGGEGVITMVVNAKGDIDPDEEVVFYISSFKEGEIITVDWGDGSVEEFRTVADEEDYYFDWFCTDDLKHSYAKRKSYTITIKGNIKECLYYGNYNHHKEVPTAPLTSLDVSKCPALKYLDCSFNTLTSLDVSKNTALEHLDCEDNNLTSLDVSKNPALVELDCEDNNLTSLDVSKCPALKELGCFGNKLTSLDLSKNTALWNLYCGNNNLTSLDISKNPALVELDCERNKLSTSALNKIFTDLLTTTAYGHINIYGNPGTATCNRSIAEKKGWKVDDFDIW